ncbi:MAG: hemolysin family protein [Thermoanaerobaculia bacterium]
MLQEEAILLILLALSAFFSASETALTSLSHTALQHLIEKSHKSLKLWLSNPIKVLITILIGNNLVNIFAASLATVLAKKHFGNLGIALVVGIMTFLIITFGEIIPKSLARKYNERISILFMPLIRLFFYLFYPFTFIFYNLTKLVSKKGEGGFKERDLIYAIQISSQKGFLPDKGAKILFSVLSLKNLKVSDIMIPRIKVCYASADTSKEELLKKFMEKGFSRMPIYEEREDNIIGILHAKELFKDYKSIKEILKPPIFVFENQRAFSVLDKMRKEKIHMACVVDEYGSFIGIVTLEDIIEEIVGEIEDEYDKKEEKYQKISENEYLFKADTPLSEVNKIFPLDFEEGEGYKTLGGFVFYKLEEKGEKGKVLKWQNYEFEISEAKGSKPLKIRVKKI